MSSVLIQADNISFSANGRQILSNVSMSLSEKEVLTIIGPNGAGKTTLLRILVGLQKPTSGKINNSKKLSFGYMPQKLHLNPNMPIPVSSFLKINTKNTRDTDAIMQELNIQHLSRTSMHKLSGGERQRVLLARALLRKPDVLILDEPAQGVDISGQSRLYELINQARNIHHCAVLMVSHDLHIVMANTDRVICLNQHICCMGHPDTVSTDAAYLSLFGDTPSPALAHYTHHHDHHHDLHGKVVDGKHNEGCNHDF
ncbi:MAG: ATP-binding cassette domain-containing protein [Pseudomonadales bacterium]|nr:ATP-binding cassette domain-containing protein [Pseudomonadales bacterium]